MREVQTDKHTQSFSLLTYLGILIRIDNGFNGLRQFFRSGNVGCRRFGRLGSCRRCGCLLAGAGAWRLGVGCRNGRVGTGVFHHGLLLLASRFFFFAVSFLKDTPNLLQRLFFS